jgi:hypothetical protein
MIKVNIILGEGKKIKEDCEMCKRIREKLFFIEG